jgi:hypothetical protein
MQKIHNALSSFTHTPDSVDQRLVEFVGHLLVTLVVGMFAIDGIGGRVESGEVVDDDDRRLAGRLGRRPGFDGVVEVDYALRSILAEFGGFNGEECGHLYHCHQLSISVHTSIVLSYLR